MILSHHTREDNGSCWYGHGTLHVQVQGAHPASYLPSQWAQASDNQLVQSSSSLQTSSIDHAPLAPGTVRDTMLIFEPGMGKIPTQYTTLLEDLASHGYVIFAITPTYSSNTVVFPNGHVAASTSTGNLDHATNLQTAGNQLVSVWAKDVLFIMDQLGKLNATPGNLFSGHLDLTRLGVFGHSFGGAIAAQVCHLEVRRKAGIDIDGDLFGDVVQTGLNKPFMVIQQALTQRCSF
jgi:Chlorophyllase enzyme